MCPLRVILIFLSATVTGFFLIRRLNAQPDFHQDADAGDESPRDTVPLRSKATRSMDSYWASFGQGDQVPGNPALGAYKREYYIAQQQEIVNKRRGRSGDGGA